MTPGHLLVQRIIETGQVDDEAGRHIAQALRRWDLSGGDGAALLRCLRIPCSPAKRRQAARDYWLSAASDILGGDTPYAQAGRLEAALARFTETWRIWRHLAEPPGHATALQGCLFRAYKAAQPPGRRQLENILAEVFSARNCGAGGRNLDRPQPDERPAP